MKIRVLIGAWLLAVASAPVHPLGLGEILVNSRLNQPLDAEILVRENTPGEAEQLVAKLAAQEDYARVGLERARLPVLVRFETGTNARGQTIIRVRSDEPVREPFMTLLVEANWSGGRLLREYGVLLDPPIAAPASRITRTAPPASAPAPMPAAPATTQPLAETPPPAPAPAVETAPAAAPPPPPPAPAPAATPAPVAAQPAPRSAPPPGFAAPPPSLPSPAAAPAPAQTPAPRLDDGTYTVQRGDTLTGIANRFAADAGVGLNQMMVALQRENPRAFFADNINALKAGAVLRVPDAGTSTALSSADAAAEVRRQNQSWTSARAPALADAGAAPVRSVAAAPAASADPRLELLPPASDAPGSEAAGRAGSDQGGAQMAETQAELQRAREDLRSRDQEMSELMSRVRDLEELNSKNARLMELKDAEVAELQRRLADASAAAAAAPAAVAEAPPVPAQPEPEVAAAPDAEAEAEAAEAAALAAAPQAGEDAITAADAEAAAAADPLGAEAIDPLLAEAADAQAGDPALAGETASEDDWAASATDSQADPFADSQSADAAPSDAASAPPPAAAEPVAESAPAPASLQHASTGTAPAATPWYLQPMVQGAALIGLALILLLALLARRQRRNAVVEEAPRRSVAELFGTPDGADTAAADGSDEALALQARLQANPDDLGAYLELLSLYYAEGDRDRFQHWAERMFEQPGAEESEEWDQVFGMGEELLPEHPLFAEDGDEDAAGQDLDEGFERYQDPTPPAASPPPPRVVDIGGNDLRFESELDDVQDQEDDMPIEFEPTRLDEPLSRSPVSAPAAVDDDADSADALPPLVFGEDDDNRAPTPAPAPAAGGRSQADSDDGGLDDAATKLELARAYLDMGDPDGARAMLEEVLGEGDTSQREEARKLLATL